jgi:CelD/BcsL family acetyltransferase involved in cellulose biosynthesis
MTVSRFNVRVDTDWADAAPRWRALMETCDATPFQRFDWLDAWYRTIAPAVQATPRLVTVTDATTGDLVMLLPLATTAGRNGPVLQFADEELTDFNAPLLGPARLARGAERALWRQVMAALPGHALASFRKMPAEFNGRVNPLAVIAGAHVSSVASNAIRLDGTYADFHAHMDRRVRMELERCWRVLTRDVTATFEHVRDEATALQILDTMDRQQRERLTETGSVFTLDEPAQAAFYRHRLAERLANGSVILTVLRANGEVVAAQYAVSDGVTAVVLRIANAGKTWSRVSPGRLIVQKSIACFYELGLKVCDLSIGDYDYKRRFGVVRTPLLDLVTALSWRGQLAATRHRAVGTLRAYPEVDARVRALARRLKPRRRASKSEVTA